MEHVSVAISAPDAALPPWLALLAERGLQAAAVGSARREECFLAGLQRILRVHAHREVT